MKAFVVRLLGLLAVLLVTGLSFATTAYAEDGGGAITCPPTPMSVTR